MFKGKDFLFLGFAEGKILGIALEIANTAFADAKKQDTLTKLNRVRKNPEAYLEDAVLAPLAIAIVDAAAEEAAKATIELKENALPYTIFGQEQIEAGALNQMDSAMRLPVTVGGAPAGDAVEIPLPAP